jgi:serine/threonine protein kinase
MKLPVRIEYVVFFSIFLFFGKSWATECVWQMTEEGIRCTKEGLTPALKMQICEPHRCTDDIGALDNEGDCRSLKYDLILDQELLHGFVDHSCQKKKRLSLFSSSVAVDECELEREGILTFSAEIDAIQPIIDKIQASVSLLAIDQEEADRRAYVGRLKSFLSPLEGQVHVAKAGGIVGRGTSKQISVVNATDGKQYAMASAVQCLQTGNKAIRLFHELEIQKILGDHHVPHVATPAGINFNDGGNIEIFQEYFPDKDLKGLQKQGVPFSRANIYQVASQTCNAIVKMHQIGVVHKDLKRDNVLVRAQYRRKGDAIARQDAYKKNAADELEVADPQVRFARLDVKVADFGESLYFKNAGTSQIHADPILGLGESPILHPDSTTGINKHPSFTQVDYQKDQATNFKRYEKNDYWQYGVMLLRILVDPRQLSWQRDGDIGVSLLTNQLEHSRAKFNKAHGLNSFPNEITHEVQESIKAFRHLEGSESSSALADILNCALDPYSMDALLKIPVHKQLARDCNFAKLCQKLPSH